MNALAEAQDGSATTMGIPLSPAAMTPCSIGTLPRNLTFMSLAVFSPPPDLKMSTVCPQWGQTNPLMFSMMPRTGIWPSWQKLRDFRTSARATFWGVVTMMASASLMVWTTVRGSSPVPGGQSMIR